jgi:hypothetical protein
MENLETIKIEKKINKSVLMRIINFSKTLCIQAILILTITLIYIKCNRANYSDKLVYFSFGLFISIFLNATLTLIYKKNFIINNYIIKIENQKNLPFILNYLKTISKNDTKTIITYYFNYTIGWHILFLLIALYYVKPYIINSQKTNYAYIHGFVYFILFGLFNIYTIDIFKIYNKKLQLTNYEFKVLLFLISVTYIILLYYFETIKLKNAV